MANLDIDLVTPFEPCAGPEPYKCLKAEIALDGVDTATASIDDISYAGHGVDKRAPDWFSWRVLGTSAPDTDAIKVTSVFMDNNDTANSNIDITVGLSTVLATATANAIKLEVRLYFLERAPDAGTSGPVGYTAPANTNF